MPEIRDSLDKPHLIDVGYGRPIKLSSVHRASTNYGINIPARNAGGISFHTDLEEAPFAIIDLETIRSISSIRVYNDENTPDRAVPLTVLGSLDGDLWHELGVASSLFGGRRSNSAFVIDFPSIVRFRYVKARADRRTFFHLDYIEIITSFSPGSNGRFRNIIESNLAIEVEYIHHDSHGFTWTFTNTLGAICNAVSAGVLVTSINYTLALQEFKDKIYDDVFKYLFQNIDTNKLPLNSHLPMIERHGVYALFDLSSLKPYVDAYFSPSDTVIECINNFIKKYKIDISSVLVVVYRGTDKSIEVTPASLAVYVAATNYILREFGERQVIIQTDQFQVREVFKSHFPECIVIEELPATSGSHAIHNLDLKSEFSLSKSEFSRRFLAVTILCSMAEFVITHTGNVGAWIALYRGSSNGLFQFDLDGYFRGPLGDIIGLDDGEVDSVKKLVHSQSPATLQKLQNAKSDEVELVEFYWPTKMSIRPPLHLPEDFDPDSYLALNPDVASAQMDAGKHYLTYGWREGRIWSLESNAQLKYNSKKIL